MSSNHPEEIKKEIKVYLTVFAALLFLSLVTVGVSYLHLSLFGAIFVALIIASIKVTLVAGYFMHLFAERTLIYIILSFVLVFALAVLILPVIEHHDPITGTTYVTKTTTPKENHPPKTTGH